jgi:uncharacterized protein YdhG (YjbR/CyaY superfamily)
MKHQSSTDSKVIKRQVRDYLTALPPDVRRTLREFDAVIRTLAPDAEPVFSYGFPGFKLEGRPFIWYAAWKRHTSLYPIAVATIKRARPSATELFESDKGTIRFPIPNPPSAAFVKRLVKARLAELTG